MRDKILARKVLMLFMLCSGFSSLVYEVLSNKVMTYVLGVSLPATTLVLIVFFLGLALGGFIFGHVAEKTKDTLKLYGFLELGISFSLIMLPFLYKRLDSVFLLICITCASTLMGGTMPVLFKYISNVQIQNISIGALYGMNTLGAALGVVLSTYGMIPHLGMTQTAFTAGALSALIGVICLALAKPGVKILSGNMQTQIFKRPASKYLIAALLMGFCCFAYEIIWFNLLALVLGNSAYAFAIMLFTILLGFVLGSFFIIFLNPSKDLYNFSKIQLLIAGSVYCSLFFWDKLGGVFSFVGVFTKSFFIMELTRFSVSSVLLLIPATLLGMTFPLLLRLQISLGRDVFGYQTGWLYTVNSLGAMIGAAFTSWVLIEYFGNRASLVTIAFLNLVLALFWGQKRKSLLMIAVMMAFIFIFLKPSWDYVRMSGGENVYFYSEDYKKSQLIYHKESTRSGAITVKKTGNVLTLFTNGKFEGNNGFEVFEQYIAALIPSIFVNEYKRACNIGLGVGGSLGVVGQFPFQEIDVVELSPDVFHVAKKYFSDINFSILDDSRIHKSIQDGRNFLLAKHAHYDLLTMQISSIWFAGASNLYNQEFYSIAHNALKDGGVFQQWFQIHHISKEDLVRVLKTMQSVFPETTVWIAEHQGVLVTSKNKKLEVDFAKLKNLDRNIKIQQVLKRLNYKSVLSVFKNLYFDSSSFKEFLRDAEAEKGTPIAISTDLNPYLEYSTPKGNADEDALTRNLDFLLYHRWFHLKDMIKNFPNIRQYEKTLNLIFDKTNTGDLQN